MIMMFLVWHEARQRFPEVQAVVDARGDKVWFEYHIHTPLGATSRDSAFYHRVARRLARQVARRFRCKVGAVKYLGCDEYSYTMPSYKLNISFI